jgi:phage terminase large subunit GpA-like protein
MVMPLGSAFPGSYRYSKTPYLREIVDCVSTDHPAHTIAVMKGAQIGVSAGVLTPSVGYIIAEAPGNILFLTGHSDLSEEAVGKLDVMIDNCGIRDLIRPSVMRKKNQKTGDTNKVKEFAGGSLVSGSATNHNLLRQRDIQYAIVDDFDAAKRASKEAGSTTTLIEQRTAAYASKRKIFYVSTPQLKHESNIEPAYLAGDQRRYHVPCPCCGEYIVWEWEVKIKNSDKEKGGITWKTDGNGKIIDGSVGYICQECGGFFDDSDKQNLLSLGQWIPTARPSQEGYYSYHISALYAPPGMFSWQHYVNQWLSANPEAGDPDQSKMKTFVNVVLGQTYEEDSIENKATELQKNQRDYAVGSIPEKMSIADGNGKIVLLTLGSDLNGKLDDARLDWEIVAWSESGSSYSVKHGSIGTFVPREGDNAPDRERWTYRFSSDKSVWVEFDRILSETYTTDTGRKMKIFIAGVDAGYMSEYVYPFVDSSNHYLFALKGDVVAKYNPFQRDIRAFKPAKERGKMYILESNQIKDDLSAQMRLVWNPKIQPKQPAGYMNFPRSDKGLYQFNNYFSHFEAEKRVTHSNASGDPVGTRWEKKDSVVQNHLFDCRCYNIAVKDILVFNVCKEMKIQNGTWQDYVNAVMGKK